MAARYDAGRGATTTGPTAGTSLAPWPTTRT
jgi:hypothetical protein